MNLAEQILAEQQRAALANEDCKVYEESILKVLRAGYPYATIQHGMHRCGKGSNIVEIEENKFGTTIELYYGANTYSPRDTEVKQNAIRLYFEQRGFWVYVVPSGRGCFTYNIVISPREYPDGYDRPTYMFTL